MKQIIIYLLLILLAGINAFSEESTLIYPPFKHNMGFNRANSSIAKMVLGRQVRFHRTEGIAALKLESENDPETRDDDAVLTMFGLNNHQLVYNVSTKKLKTYGNKGLGNEPDIMFYPTDIAADDAGNIYISDTYNYRILKLFYNGEADSIEYVGAFGEYGSDSFSVNLPRQLDLDGKGNLYISDSRNNRILVLDSLLNTIRIIEDVNEPGGIAVIDRSKGWCAYRDKPFIIVVSGRTRLIKMTVKGEIISEQFSHNVDRFMQSDFNFIDYDYQGNIWVTDTVNSVIHKFDSKLQYITSFGSEGYGRHQFYKPNGISIFRKFGQVFIGERGGFQYYWIGVDGWLDGITPDMVNDSTPGITISLYTTEQCRATIEIMKDGEIIRKLTKYLKRDIGLNHILWDMRNNDGKRITQSGIYHVKITLEALYSSRGYFTKEIRGEFEKY